MKGVGFILEATVKMEGSQLESDLNRFGFEKIIAEAVIESEEARR